MSAPAVKSSMPGVVSNPATPSHSIIPLNATPQKVVSSGTETTIKSITGSGLNFVTLQSANPQPLSLVQDHRPSAYPTAPYSGTTVEKESEVEKVIPNGVELTKIESEQEPHPPSKQTDNSCNNNVSPDPPDNEIAPQAVSNTNPPQTPESPAAPEQLEKKTEEQKVPSNNNSPKETEEIVSNVSLQTKTSPQKVEDSVTTKLESVPKIKATNPTVKVTPEPNNTQTVVTKAQTKVSHVPKATKRKSKELKDVKGNLMMSDGASKPKRNRTQTQPYQSPLPEIALFGKALSKIPASKAPDDKLIVFYKNEFLAVRNAEGSFFVCQSMQNVYKSSKRIRIRWLSQDKNNGEIYSPDFYDFIDFDCILTNLNLNKTDKNKFQLTKIELLRTENILKRAIDVEAGVSEKPRVTEEHPDGLDLSLYKDESQLKRRRRTTLSKQKQMKRKQQQQQQHSSSSESDSDDKKSLKSRTSKKPLVNKTMALAKSVAKSPNRAERALNRSSKSNTSLDTVTTTDSNPKSSTEPKKVDLKKPIKQTTNNNASGLTRGKSRGTNSNAIQEASTTRPKRQGGTTAPNDDSTSRKKPPRGRV